MLDFAIRNKLSKKTNNAFAITITENVSLVYVDASVIYQFPYRSFSIADYAATQVTIFKQKQLHLSSLPQYVPVSGYLRNRILIKETIWGFTAENGN